MVEEEEAEAAKSAPPVASGVFVEPRQNLPGSGITAEKSHQEVKEQNSRFSRPPQDEAVIHDDSIPSQVSANSSGKNHCLQLYSQMCGEHEALGECSSSSTHGSECSIYSVSYVVLSHI
jgi:hypothetical protein